MRTCNGIHKRRSHHFSTSYARTKNARSPSRTSVQNKAAVITMETLNQAPSGHGLTKAPPPTGSPSHRAKAAICSEITKPGAKTVIATTPKNAKVWSSINPLEINMTLDILTTSENRRNRADRLRSCDIVVQLIFCITPYLSHPSKGRLTSLPVSCSAYPFAKRSLSTPACNGMRKRRGHHFSTSYARTKNARSPSKKSIQNTTENTTISASNQAASTQN